MNFYNNLINVLFVLLMFVLPISVVVSNIIIFFIVLFWILEDNFKNKFFILIKNKFFISYTAIILSILLSTIFSKSINNGFLITSGLKNEYYFIIKYLLVFYIVIAVFITSVKEININKIIKAFIYGMFFSEIVSYLIYFNLINIEYFKHIGLLSKKASSYNPSPFLNHSFYSVLLAIAILLLIDNVLKKFSFINFIFIITMLSNLFINGGRTGQLAFLIGLIIYLIKRFNYKYIIIGILLSISIFFIAYKISPTFHNRINLAYDNIRQVYKYSNYNTSWGKRLAMDTTIIKLLLRNPKNFVFGLGAGDAKQVILNYAKNNKNILTAISDLVHTHNQYLQFWIDGGLLALFAFLYILFLMFKSNNAVVSSIAFVIMFACVSDVFFYRYQIGMIMILIVLSLLKINKVNE